MSLFQLFLWVLIICCFLAAATTVQTAATEPNKTRGGSRSCSKSHFGNHHNTLAMAHTGGVQALSSWELCVKYAIFIFNFFFWLAGTGVFAVGLWLRFDSRTVGLLQGGDSPSVFVTGVYILIAAGALMMIVGFLGCCGAIKESPCMLGLFFALLLVIFAVEVAAGIWGFSNKEKVVEDLTEFYKQTYNNYKDTKQEALKETLRLIHFGLDCCGTTGTVVEFARDTCPKQDGLTVSKSCPAAIDEMFNNKLHIIGGIGIGIGVITVFGMIFSMILCCAIKRSRDYV